MALLFLGYFYDTCVLRVGGSGSPGCRPESRGSLAALGDINHTVDTYVSAGGQYTHTAQATYQYHKFGHSSVHTGVADTATTSN
jgi:hypothetical protein